MLTARLALTLLLALGLAGCGTTYLAQAARGQVQLLRARQPIERLLQRPDTPPDLRERLRQVQRIRDFASRELGLPDNRSYRSYADLGRPYVVWNVVAAPPLSIQPREWCFPVAGCVAYRGYFRETAARRFAARLAARGDDVTVGGVPAYSTLGRFADPVLNTMTGYGELELAAVIFHELAHQVWYLPGDTAANEAFATTVEEAGLARYAQAVGRPDAVRAWRERRDLRRRHADLFVARRRELGQLFKSGQSDEAKRAGKAAVLAGLADDIRALERETGRSTGYGRWLAEGLNNAHLASVAIYHESVPRFERLLQGCGGYLPCFYVEVRREQEKKAPHAAGPEGGSVRTTPGVRRLRQ
jgi:predicted aminopeptidase